MSKKKQTETDAESTETDAESTDPRRVERAAVEALTDGQLVEARTADTTATVAATKVPNSEHVKVFVIPGDGAKPTAANYDHDANIAATRQYMVSNGLRPTGDVTFKGAEAFGPGGKSWALTYAAPAVPAERFDFQPVSVLDQSEETDTKAAD